MWIIMKKLVTSLLCLLLLSSTCYAEVNFRVEDYDDDELIEIMQAICEADSKLGYWYSNDVLVVGEDIPAGAYEFGVEEDDIGLSKDMIEEPLDYHCEYTTLCDIQWGAEYDRHSFENYISIYCEEYGVHKPLTLEEGQFLWTREATGGSNFRGLRMKYVPNRRSGLFSDQ